MKVLVINAGSSSLKYQLLDPETGHLLAKGLCERIGIDGKFTYKPQVEGKAVISAADVPMPTHSEAIQAVLDALVDKDNGVIGSMKEIDAVGHRVVHGGESFASSVLITDQVMQAVEDCTPLAPLHNPANIIGINLVSVLQFAYGSYTGREALRDSALTLLERLPAEDNRYMRGWHDAGLTPRSAFESQALLQLATEYCAAKRCAECPVGRRILNNLKIGNN